MPSHVGHQIRGPKASCDVNLAVVDVKSRDKMIEMGEQESGANRDNQSTSILAKTTTDAADLPGFAPKKLQFWNSIHWLSRAAQSPAGVPRLRGADSRPEWGAPLEPPWIVYSV